MTVRCPQPNERQMKSLWVYLDLCVIPIGRYPAHKAPPAQSGGALFMSKKGNYKHGYFGTPTYKSWAGIKERCKNKGRPGFKNWGGRGITYDPRWESFENFVADMGECPDGMSIDRIDNNGNYELSNCRWATWKEQARNRRNTRLFEGKTLSEWSEVLGIKRSTLAQRLYVYGWPIERVLSK